MRLRSQDPVVEQPIQHFLPVHTDCLCLFLTPQNALLVYICELLIDVIKHSFLAKFNEIKPVAYSEFLEDLCKQVLCQFCSFFVSNIGLFLYWIGNENSWKCLRT